MKDWFEGHPWSLFHDEPRKTVAPYWLLVFAVLAGLGAALVMVRLYSGS